MLFVKSGTHVYHRHRSDSKPSQTVPNCISIRNPIESLVSKIVRKSDIQFLNGNTLSLQWIPGHHGIVGNQQAEILATGARLNEYWELLPQSASYVKHFLPHLRHAFSKSPWVVDGTREPLLYLSGTFLHSIRTYINRAANSLLRCRRLEVPYTCSFYCPLGQVTSPYYGTWHVSETVGYPVLESFPFARQRNTL